MIFLLFLPLSPTSSAIYKDKISSSSEPLVTYDEHIA